MKKRTKVMVFMLTIVMMLSQLGFLSYTKDVSLNSTEKITDELAETMENASNSEYIYVYIWLSVYSEDFLYAHLSNKLKTEVCYKSEQSYLEKRIADKIEKFNINRSNGINLNCIDVDSKLALLRENACVSEIMTDEEIRACIGDGMADDKIIELSERKQYLSEYRFSRASVNNLINDNFVQKLDKSRCKNISCDLSLPYIKLNVF